MPFGTSYYSTEAAPCWTLLVNLEKVWRGVTDLKLCEKLLGSDRGRKGGGDGARILG